MIPRILRSIAATTCLAACVLLAAVVLVGCGSSGAEEGQTADLLKAQRFTERFHNYYTALAEGYVSGFVCAPGDLPPNQGAAGIHLGNYRLIRDGKLDVTQPDILIYLPTETDYRLVALEYVVPDHGQKPPKLFGQTLARFDASNTPGFKTALPPGSPPLVYYLHVWLNESNPRGFFADSNPRLRCPPPPHVFSGPGPVVGGAASGHLPKSAGPATGDFLHLSIDAGIDPRFGPTGRFDINHLNATTGQVVTKLHGVVKCLKVQGKTAMASAVITKGSVPALPGYDPAGETMAVTIKDLGRGKYTFAIDLSFLPPRHQIRPCQPVTTDIVKVERGFFVIR